MASSKEYLDFILEQLSELEEMSYRPMMGEYILYYRGKIIGGVYDNRLLLKPVKVVMDQLGQTRLERPYVLRILSIRNRRGRNKFQFSSCPF